MMHSCDKLHNFYILKGLIVILVMTPMDDARKSKRIYGTVPAELTGALEGLYSLGYTDTEIIKEGIRLICAQKGVAI